MTLWWQLFCECRQTLCSLLLLLKTPDRLFNSFCSICCCCCHRHYLNSLLQLSRLLFGFVCLNYLLFALIFPFTTSTSSNSSCYYSRNRSCHLFCQHLCHGDILVRWKTAEEVNHRAQAHNKLNHLKRISDCVQCNWHYSYSSLPLSVQTVLAESKINWHASWCTQTLITLASNSIGLLAPYLTLWLAGV